MAHKSFASDNFAGIHPLILQAIIDANHGHEKPYSNSYTHKAAALFKLYFGTDIEVSFVGTGTAANVLGLSTMLKPYQGIICAQTAHINTYECGAVERFTGSKLLPVPTIDGKLTVEMIEQQLVHRGSYHFVQPKAVSITQVTEQGTLYTADEIKKIADVAHENDMYLHMDGARLCNAAAHLDTTLAAVTKDVGVDVLSFGGTKNGLMMAEAVIFFNSALAQDFANVRQQGMQLISKSRFIAAQFIALFTDDVWLKNARHANSMAQYLADEIKKIPQLTLTRSVQANAVFATLDPKTIPVLQKKFYFYIWNKNINEVRFMTAWDTTHDDVDQFVEHIKKSV